MRRRKRKSSGPVVLILVLLVLIVLLLYKIVFVVRSVQITGTSNISADQIVRAADLDYGGSIFLCDEGRIKRGIDSLGEVELVGLAKKLPSTLVIEVKQRTAAAALVHMNEIILTDENGYMIRSAKTLPTGCVYFTGVHIMSCRVGSKIVADNGQVELMHSIITSLSLSGGAKYVKEVDIDDASDIRITAVNNTEVALGGSENISNKIAWMTAAIADLVERNQSGGTLDVSSGTKADYVKPVIQESE